MNPAVSKPLNTLADLTPAARQAVESKKISGSWSAKALLRLLGELQKWDLGVEERKKAAHKRVIGSGIAMVVSIFALFAFLIVGLWFIGVPVTIGLIIFFVVSLRAEKALKAVDIPDEFRIVVRPLLRQLSQDINPEEKVRVECDLAGITEAKIKDAKDIGKLSYQSAKLTVYEDPLCHIRLALLDGTEAVFSIDNTMHKVVGTKRNSRGKTKTKTKWKKVTTLTASLVPPRRINWEVGKSQQLVDTRTEKITFAEKNGVMVAKLQKYYSFKSMGDEPTGTAPSSDATGLFVRLYAMRPAAGGAR
jgi:hypothetical protein